MGQQQLLLIILGVIIVGIAVAVGITMFKTNAVSANRDALIGDMPNFHSSPAVLSSSGITRWRRWRVRQLQGSYEGNRTFVVTGNADIETVADRLGLQIEREGFETFGGYLLASLGRVPAVGEVFDIGVLTVEVLDAERRRIHRVRVRRRAAPADGAAQGTGESQEHTVS